MANAAATIGAQPMARRFHQADRAASRHLAPKLEFKIAARPIGATRKARPTTTRDATISTKNDTRTHGDEGGLPAQRRKRAPRLARLAGSALF